MPRRIDNSPEHGKTDQEEMKQIMSISSYVGDLGIKILPGSSWMPHYTNASAREKALSGLLTGKIKPDDVDESILRPDGFTYDFKDYQTLGLNGMVGKIREQAELYTSFDYKAFKNFLYGLKGKDIDLETAVHLFNQIGKSRVKNDLLKRLGSTGQKQLKASLKQEAERILNAPEDTKRIQKMLDALSMRWMHQKGIISKTQLEEFEKTLSEETLHLADTLGNAFLDYVNKGDKESRKELIKHITDNFETIKKQQEQDDTDDIIDQSIKDPGSLPPEQQKQIDDMFDDFNPPQGDTPPDFNQEFSPSMDPMKEGEKNQPPQALYTIEPPLKGHYQGPVYNNFNVNEVKWETKPKLQTVSSGTASSDHTISGKINSGSMIPLFLPRNYGVGTLNLPKGLSLSRDEAGCYYLQNKAGSTIEYSVPFGKENFASTTPPGSSETADISSGGLSSSTISYLKSLSGLSNTAKAKQIVHYMKNILKLVYSNDAKYNVIYKKNPRKYFAEIENHKQVDCDVAQTYFIALCRAAGIPSRIVTGHKVDFVKNGKAVIHGGSGHAWTEIWDDSSNTWKTIDATPEGQSEGEKGDSEKAPEEKPDIDVPQQEPRDEEAPPSTKDVKEKVDKKIDDVKKKDKQKSEKGKGEGQGEDGEGGEGEEGSVSDEQWDENEQKMEDMKQQHEQMEKNAAEMKDKLQDAKKFDDLKDIKDQLDKSELYDKDKEKLEDLLKANQEKLQQELKEKIEKMKEDGFISEEEAEKLLKELDKQKENLDALNKVEENLSHENNLYNDYLELKDEVMPLVDQWFEFFAERLPKIEDVDFDEEVNTLRGRFDKRSVNKPRNLIFGRTQNPAIIRSSIKPRFIASIILDISGSMGMYMRDARKLLIFFSELFDKISAEYGYIKFSISAFDQVVEVIKDFDQEYSSAMRYEYGPGIEKTVKVRLMETATPRGGTDMGKAVWHANQKLNEAVKKYPDHLSALYTISDGETGGELAGQKLHNFLHGIESAWGEWWGDHMKCGYMLGPESQKAVLSQYFGEEDSESVPVMEDLIEKVMMRFDEDVKSYIDKIQDK